MRCKRRKTGSPPGFGTPEQESVAAPSRTWYLTGTRKFYDTLNGFHNAVRDAKTLSYWSCGIFNSRWLADCNNSG